MDILDFLRKYVCSLKLPFLASLSLNFSAISLHIPSKFINKSAQKLSFFSSKANYIGSLFKLFRENQKAYELLSISRYILLTISFLLVAFGQPAWFPWSGFAAGFLGFALFWRVLLAYPCALHRFYLGTIWFTAVQLIQLSWFTSHPYHYIYAVYFLLSLGMGIQFGIIAILIKARLFSYPSLFSTCIRLIPIASLWTLFEWSRLFILSGFSWNPVGLAFTSNIYALQAASIAGIFGLSFWLIWVNLLGLWAWMQKSLKTCGIWLFAGFIPYIYGSLHLFIYSPNNADSIASLTALLVQTAFPTEEAIEFSQKKDLIQHVVDEWRVILESVKNHDGKKIDLIVLPEFVVPFGTYSDVYPLIEVKKAFYEILDKQSLDFLPSLGYPFASFQKDGDTLQCYVNNAYWSQGLANYFNSDVIIGLEDAEDISFEKREYYSSAIFLHPQKDTSADFFAERYTKRVLVPMGEYIPFEWCKKLAAKYGIFSSFTCGKEAVIMDTHGVLISPSICYEETFANIMREGRKKGADLFVNLTSDVWYPNSKLPKQHLDHARLRTVENGIPLIRACNTGITAAIDSFGRNIIVLGGEHPERVEWVPDALLVEVPLYSYSTLFSFFGDSLVIGICIFSILLQPIWLIKK